MKVNSTSAQNASIQKFQQKPQKTADSKKQDLHEKLKDKFGKDFGKKAADAEKNPDTLVTIDKKGQKKVSKEAFGDIKKNDPASEATQEKLKGLLRSGGFQFSDKERAALDAILNN